MRRLETLLNFYHTKIKKHPASDIHNIPPEHREIFDAIASLIDLPDDGRLFFQTKLVVKCLILAYQNKTKASFEWSSIQSLYARGDEPLSMGEIKDKLWRSKGDHPIFTFLCQSAIDQEDLSLVLNNSRYVALVPFLLRRIRFLQHNVQGANLDYICRLALAARKIVVGAPSLRNHSTFDWSNKTLLTIAREALNFTIGESRKLTANRDVTSILDLFFRERNELSKRPGGGGGGGGDRQLRWLLLEQSSIRSAETDFEFDQGSEDDGFMPTEFGKPCIYRFTSPTYEKFNKKIAAAGEYPADYEEKQVIQFPGSWFVDPWTAKRKERGKVEGMVAAQRIMPWDKSCLSTSSIADLLMVLKEDPEAWKGVLSLSLLAGLTEKSLKALNVGIFNAKIKPSESETKRLLKGERFFDPDNGMLWWTNSLGTSEGKYLAPPLIVAMKLPDFLVQHMFDYFKIGEKLFSVTNIAKAKRFLRTMNGDGVSEVTLKRLSSTFDAFFIHGAGLPELFADHMQNRHRLHLGSQHYYITLDWSHLVDEWHRMVETFVNGVSSEKKSVSEVLAMMKYSVHRKQVSEETNLIHVGANKTPSRSALRDHFSNLKTCFPNNEKDLICCNANKWNAYMAYIYGLYAVTTGNRPQRDPMPRMSFLNLNQGWVYIDDKHNRMFKESRIVPFCPTLKRSLKIHSQIHQDWLMAKVISGYALGGPPDSFFLIDEEEKRLVPVSPSECDRLLRNSMAMNELYFEGLGNGFRHYLLTTLHQAGVPQLMIDSLSGHRHMGIEPEFMASPVSWKNSAIHLTEIIEVEVVRPLELVTPLA